MSHSTSALTTIRNDGTSIKYEEAKKIATKRSSCLDINILIEKLKTREQQG